MIVYHGTTQRRARRICLEGFLPRKPSRRVWFARGKAYAEGRARTQARRAHDRRETEALECLADDSPRRRVRGLKLLAELADPDLFEWCPMYLDDASAEVRVAALRTMRG